MIATPPAARRPRWPSRPHLPFLAAALVALAAAACAGDGSPSPAATPATPASPAPASPAATPAANGAVPQATVDAAVADAAARAGVDPAGTTVVAAEARDFPDGALGCPEPGMMYPQVITPGYRVVVAAGGREYDYRAAARGDAAAVRWCDAPPPAG